MAALRVLFIHGKESSPQGTKGRVLADAFVSHGEQMNTADFPGSVALQAEAIERFRPDVVVGSSYGGAVLCALLRARKYEGPTLLLAPAALKLDPGARIPAGVPTVIVHGLHDDVVPIEDSRALARTGTPGAVVLHEVHDDHRLTRTVASGRLVELVHETYALSLQMVRILD